MSGPKSKLHTDGKEVSEGMYRQILDAIADMVLVKAEGSRIVWANKAFRDFYGMGNAELKDMIDASFNKPDYTQQYIRDDLYVFSTGKTLDIPSEPVTRHDGQVNFFHTVKSPIVDSNQRPCMTVGVSRDITEQKKNQEELEAYRHDLERLVKERARAYQDSSERLNATLQSIGDAVIATDSEGIVELLNPAAEELVAMKQSQACGGHLDEVLNLRREGTSTPLSFEANLKNAASGSTRRWTAELTDKQRKTKIVSVTSARYGSSGDTNDGVVLVLRDVTEERRTTAEVLRYQKLESLGVLAGGIAHDFNNILTGVLGHITLARMLIEDEQRLGELLESSERSCLRAQALTQQLLTFARGGSPIREPVSLHTVLADAAGLAVHGTSAQLTLKLAPDLSFLYADEGQIGQVVNNLVLNSVQAMPAGGSIVIESDNVVLSRNNNLSMPAGKYVRIKISDTGIGIAPDDLSKVFDPYFTTKDKGSGLGLSSSHSIVRNHDGRISISSVQGEGTCVSIHLPAYEGPVEKVPNNLHAKKTDRSLRVLVMDDDSGVRDVLKQMMLFHGHDATLTADGDAAIAAFRQAVNERRPYDLVLLDLTVPGGMGGREVLPILASMDPNLRAIVISGYSNLPVLSDFREHGFVDVIRKPFTMDRLLEVLEKHGERRSATA